MNYRDYVAIMESEGLRLPNFAEQVLEDAKSCQRVIKRLKSETNFNLQKQIKQMEERKIGYILEAIEWARMAKEDPDLFRWGERVYEKQLKRRTRI